MSARNRLPCRQNWTLIPSRISTIVLTYIRGSIPTKPRARAKPNLLPSPPQYAGSSPTASEYTLSQVTRTLAGREQRRSDAVRQFVVNTLVMHAMLAKFPSIAQLLTDLRYGIQTEKSPALGDLPLVTIRSCLPSFRPADTLMLTAIRFSGVPAFIELIDIETLNTLQDPLKLRLEKILQ